MLAYLKKFNELPVELREQVSGPEAMAAISELEKTFSLPLAAMVMRVMIKDISILDLAKYFVLEHSLDAKRSEELVAELKKRVLAGAAEHLGFNPEPAPASPESDPAGKWAQGQEQNMAIRGSNFFFSSEDEEEVRNLTLKMHEKKIEPQIRNQQEEKAIMEKVEKISALVRINFSSEELHKRLKQVMTTYVKGVRNRIDTKQTILRGVDEGGLALNDALANKLLAAADRVKQETADTAPPAEAALPGSGREQEAKPALPADTERDIPYDFGALARTSPPAAPAPSQPAAQTAPEPASQPAKAEEIPLKPGQKKEIDLDRLDFSFKDKPIEISSDQPAPAKSLKEINRASASADLLASENVLDLRAEGDELPGAGESAPNYQVPEPAPTWNTPAGPEPVLDLKDTASPDNASASMRKTAQLSASFQPDMGGKIRMNDVKYVPKLTGPIDELNSLSLQDFRRLGENGAARVRKIMEKISFLEQDNYQERLNGIKAWRQSPVNRLYLAIGQSSIAGNQGIGAIIKKAAENGKEVLSYDEFNAIMELNKELRF